MLILIFRFMYIGIWLPLVRNKYLNVALAGYSIRLVYIVEHASL